MTAWQQRFDRLLKAMAHGDAPSAKRKAAQSEERPAKVDKQIAEKSG